MNKSWEKDFDEKFSPYVLEVNNFSVGQNIKQFIHQLLQTQREELIKKVEGMENTYDDETKRWITPSGTWITEAAAISDNVLLDQVISLLKEAG